MKLNKEQIIKIQKNRDPFLMVDEVIEVLPGKKIHAKKILKEDEWFFKVHWPGDPNMPGVLQIESMTQACAICLQTLPEFEGKKIYLSKITKTTFLKKVLPNNDLEIFGKILSFKRGVANCEAYTKYNDEVASKSEITIIIPEIIKKIIK